MNLARRLLAAAVLSTSLGAAAQDVLSAEVKGKLRHFTLKNIPAQTMGEIVGTYLYEAKDEPKIVLDADGTGIFQPHTKDDIRIKWWLESTEAGEVQKKEGVNGNQLLTLVMQYQEGSVPEKLTGNYPPGGYGAAPLAIWRDKNKVTLFGERIKELKSQ